MNASRAPGRRGGLAFFALAFTITWALAEHAFLSNAARGPQRG